MAVPLDDLAAYLDRYLRVHEVADGPGALNGLQVQNSGTVTKLAAAVDACQATIDAAVASGADLLLVHHGLLWGDAKPVTGRQWHRLKGLLDGDVALYSAHIPLDCHPEVGNNAVLARELGIAAGQPFGDHYGTAIGIAGTLALSRGALLDRIAEITGHRPHLIPGGPEEVNRVAVVTGAGGSLIDQVRDAGIDTYLTGEGTHHTHFDAEEWRINVIYAGHYATETFGVKALAAHLEEKFGTPWEFLDHPTGL